ncbi:MAG: hypothetical protein IKD64_09200, partial [Lachnospiraceae bacterium]|nr:hypothetical protein [Lachnospiraceae bacterium]
DFPPPLIISICTASWQPSSFVGLRKKRLPQAGQAVKNSRSEYLDLSMLALTGHELILYPKPAVFHLLHPARAHETWSPLDQER